MLKCPNVLRPTYFCNILTPTNNDLVTASASLSYAPPELLLLINDQPSLNMPAKVRVVVDHLVEGDESSLTPEQVKDSVVAVHPTLSGGVVKVNNSEVRST